MSKITFSTQDLIVEAPSGTEFLELYNKNPNIPLKFGCRRGECGVCAVRIAEGQQNLTKQSKQEILILQQKHLDPGNHRLACQCAFNGNVTVEVDVARHSNVELR